jgi:hypothetical protein
VVFRKTLRSASRYCHTHATVKMLVSACGSARKLVRAGFYALFVRELSLTLLKPTRLVFLVSQTFIATLFALLRLIKLLLCAVPATASLLVWCYIAYNIYVMSVILWLRENMYAAERVNIFSAVYRRYSNTCSLLSLVCDYSLLFCATTTLYESLFITTSIANRVLSCLCVALLTSCEGEFSQLHDLSSEPVIEVFATEELAFQA